MIIRCNENSTFRYLGILRDEKKNLITNAVVSTLTLTLYNESSDAIINGRNVQNVLNANGVVLYDALQTDADGKSYNMEWTASPGDNPILDATVDSEEHEALFQWTYGALGGKHVVTIRVSNLHLVP